MNDAWKEGMRVEYDVSHTKGILSLPTIVQTQFTCHFVLLYCLLRRVVLGRTSTVKHLVHVSRLHWCFCVVPAPIILAQSSTGGSCSSINQLLSVFSNLLSVCN